MRGLGHQCAGKRESTGKGPEAGARLVCLQKSVKVSSSGTGNKWGGKAGKELIGLPVVIEGLSAFT